MLLIKEIKTVKYRVMAMDFDTLHEARVYAIKEEIKSMWEDSQRQINEGVLTCFLNFLVTNTQKLIEVLVTINPDYTDKVEVLELALRDAIQEYQSGEESSSNPCTEITVEEEYLERLNNAKQVILMKKEKKNG